MFMLILLNNSGHPCYIDNMRSSGWLCWLCRLGWLYFFHVRLIFRLIVVGLAGLVHLKLILRLVVLGLAGLVGFIFHLRLIFRLAVVWLVWFI